MAYSKQECVQSLQMNEEFFNRSTSVLDEDDSTFVPAPGALSTAAQVAHVAITIDWFFDAAYTPKGWDMDFEAHMKEATSYNSLGAARERLARSFDRARETVEALSQEEFSANFPPDDPLFPGMPKACIVDAIADHTAHHRGALTIYSRLVGKVPKIPYMDEPADG